MIRAAKNANNAKFLMTEQDLCNWRVACEMNKFYSENRSWLIQTAAALLFFVLPFVGAILLLNQENAVPWRRSGLSGVAVRGLAIGSHDKRSIIYATGSEAIRSVRVGEYLYGSTRFPIYPSRILVAFGMLLLSLQFVVDFFRVLVKPATGSDQTEEKEH